ncbi:hypothetical protein GGQ74_000308 [Desulfobaculum xiamenense]|uniref:Uncharacterized protein n=1 Tax=Desulfobaculum xiamenense TaxID=995050 RepID=A0A846QE71_9BACT|nr:hypothetical protein [Desulfobaculum xiamenense]NJB66668.1 hypothetical protein [Desulfobaculum xiamenense]
MLSALAYKEWLKLRRVFWVPIAAAAVGLGDTLLTYRHVNEIIGPVMLWLDAVYYDKVFFSGVMFAGVFAGAWFALFQFVPECAGNRLRLLFHLPVPHRRSVYFIAGTGLCATAAVAGGTLLGVALIVGRYMPAEAVARAIITCAPWMLAALPAYMGTALVVMESSWVRRLCLGITTALFIMPLFASQVPGAYATGLPAFAAASLLWLLPLDVQAHRFKRGTRW